MNTPTHNANTLRTAVLMPSNRRRRPTDWLQLSRELDETFAEVDFDREPRHTSNKNFAPSAELMNDEVEMFVISPSDKRELTSFKELDRQISATEVDPAYESFEVRSIY